MKVISTATERRTATTACKRHIQTRTRRRACRPRTRRRISWTDTRRRPGRRAQLSQRRERLPGIGMSRGGTLVALVEDDGRRLSAVDKAIFFLLTPPSESPRPACKRHIQTRTRRRACRPRPRRRISWTDTRRRPGRRAQLPQRRAVARVFSGGADSGSEVHCSVLSWVQCRIYDFLKGGWVK